MSAFTGGFPIPPAPSTAPVMAWDGRQFSPTTALAIVSLTLSGALAAASITDSGLSTSGGVVFNSAAGLLQNSAGLTYSSNVLVVGDASGSATVRVDGAAGGTRQITFRTAGVNRWLLVGASGTAEAGANAGSNFALQAIDDAGSTIDSPISIARVAGGAIVCARPLQPGSGSAGAPSYAFSTDTTTGLFRVSSGTISHVGAGTEYLRAGTAQWTYSRNASVALGTAPVQNVGTLTVHGVDATATTVALCAYGAASSIIARRTNGTASALTALASGDTMFSMQVVGYEGTTPGFTSNRNGYLIQASETFTSTAQGFFHAWYANNTGTTSAIEKMRLSQGNLLIGTTTDGMTANGSLAIAQDLAHRGSNLGVFNTTPTTKKTGYGTPTNAAVQSSFDASSITLVNLAKEVAQLVLDLKAYGMIGA